MARAKTPAKTVSKIKGLPLCMASRHRLLSPGLKFIKLKHFSWQASWWHEKMYDSWIQEIKTKIKSWQLPIIICALCQNFGGEINGTLWSAWKFSGQLGPPPEVVLLDGWSGPTKTSRSTSKNFRFQSYFAKQEPKFRPKHKWIVSMRLKTLFQ